MKLTNHTYGCNNLADFEYEDTVTGNGNDVNQLKTETRKYLILMKSDFTMLFQILQKSDKL